MPADENAPIGMPTGKEPDTEERAGAGRRGGLILGLLLAAALLIVAGLLIRRAQSESPSQRPPVARPIPAGSSAPVRLALPKRR